MSEKAISSIGTVLKYGATASALTQLCRIKNYPDLGGAPDQLETTDLEDETQTFVPGVQSMDAMEFTINYTKDTYKAILATANKAGFYQLEFGEDGKDGTFIWQGQHSIFVTGGDVNAVREMTLSVSPSTKISLVEPTP